LAAEVTTLAARVIGQMRGGSYRDAGEGEVMNIANLNVVVVGGATGGAATALLLARAGARVTLIEKIAEPRAVGAGIAIAENGMAVLESLGLKPAVSAAACVVAGVRVVDGTGRTLLAPPPPEPTGWMLRRSALQTIFLDALAAEPLVECHFGAEVTGATGAGTVTAATRAGATEFHADLIVGADGVHSRVRSCGRFDAHVSRPGITYVRTLVPESLAQGVEAWTAAGLFGSFAVPDGTYVYASGGSRACTDAIAHSDLEGFRAAWSAAYPASAELLGAVARWDDLIVNRVRRVECGRWSDGRIVLLGDAAHAMPPNLGQGANSAVVDAAVLLDELRRAAGVADALRAYEARRRPAVRRVARAAARLGTLAELTNPIARAMRDRILMPIVARLARGSDIDFVLQEPVATLRAIGRA